MIFSGDILIRLSLPLLIAAVAVTTKALDYKGIFAGLVLAYIVVITHNAYWFAVLLGFFVIGSFATRFKEKEKTRFKPYEYKMRTAHHVIANGSIAIIMALFAYFYGFIYFFGFLGALATATADTVSSEIGLLSKKRPLLITTLKPARTGAEGAISFLGTSAGLIGALVIGLLGLLVLNDFRVVLIAVLAGLVGNFVDSYVGATFETKRYVSNSGTNFIATSSGALLGLMLGFLIQ